MTPWPAGPAIARHTTSRPGPARHGMHSVPTDAAPAPAVDLREVDLREQALPGHEWACPECGLLAGPFVAAEAAMLAGVHDQIMGHPLRTTVARPLTGSLELGRESYAC